jgi:hypothetical protein
MGVVGSETNATWRVNTPEGIGWVYTRYLASLHQADDD